MKNGIFKIIAVLLLYAAFSCSGAKKNIPHRISLEEIVIEQAPALNSFAFAVQNGQWLIMGGRTDGLHDHRPDRAYPPEKSNQSIWLIDPGSKKVWEMEIAGLPVNLFEQMQSTNMSFYQDTNTLVLIGGYGWSNEIQDYKTFPFITFVDVPGLINAVKNDEEISTFFYQIENQNMAVAGGYLGKIGDEFNLVFGNRFDGRYSARPNDMHIQKYTNEIRKFSIGNETGKPEVTNYSAIRDTANFHRRDFNLLPQIFPNGDFGYTAFSGVFQYDRNFPWLHPVNIFDKGYEAVEGFEQKFSHYHSACVSVFHKQDNQTDNLFFGGMARFAPDPKTGEIVNDPLVPSVSTISQVTRFADGRMEEAMLETEMPGLLGASASFFLDENIPSFHGKIIDYDNLPKGKTLIGYVYGGLESTHPNIFLRFEGVSKSTNRIFKVFVIKE